MAELIATYRDPEAARRAITTLERHGVDAACINLLEAPGADVPKTDAAMREPDMAMTGDIGRRGFVTAVVAAVVLGAIAAVIGYVVAQETGALLGGVGFFVAGGALGFFYGGASALPVSEEWSDTFESHGETTLAVTVPDDEVVDLRDRLEATNPSHLSVS